MAVGNLRSSLRKEIEEAPAVAIDCSLPNTEGREQRGDVYMFQSLIRRYVDQSFIHQRVIRKVLSVSKTSDWGPIGSALDTTETDWLYESFGPENSDWYLEEGLSSAVIVFEANVDNTKLWVKLGARYGPIEKFSVAKTFSLILSRCEVGLFLFDTVRPVVALPDVNMQPGEIVTLMEA